MDPRSPATSCSGSKDYIGCLLQMLASQHACVTKCSSHVPARSSIVGDKCVSSYPSNQWWEIHQQNHLYKLLELNVNSRSSSSIHKSHVKRHIDTKRVIYTRDVCGSDSGLLSLVLIHGKGIINANHNRNHLLPHLPPYSAWLFKLLELNVNSMSSNPTSRDILTLRGSFTLGMVMVVIVVNFPWF